jgi:hypothetical protein
MTNNLYNSQSQFCFQFIFPQVRSNELVVHNDGDFSTETEGSHLDGWMRDDGGRETEKTRDGAGTTPAPWLSMETYLSKA